MTFETTADLLAAKNEVLGVSSWREVTQAMIDAFADVVDDHQWIHVEVDRAADGPFGSTIAHGMLTVSLVPTMMSELVKVEHLTFGVNYGFDRVRFLSPVPAGSRVRGQVEIIDTVAVEGGVRATFRVSVEVEGVERPACVADNIVVFYD